MGEGEREGEAFNPAQNHEPTGNSGSCSNRAQLRCLIFVLFLCGLMLLYYLIIDPYDPDLPEFRVVSAAVSPCPLIPSSNHYLTATWDLTVEATNPSRFFDLHYENAHQAFLVYGDEKHKDKVMLAAAPLPLLRLAKMEKTTLNITLATVRAYVGDDMAKELLTTTTTTTTRTSESESGGGGGGGCYGSARLGVRLFGSVAYVPPPARDYASFFCDLVTANNGSVCQPFATNSREKC